jgi:hypothetical protein
MHFGAESSGFAKAELGRVVTINDGKPGERYH